MEGAEGTVLRRDPAALSAIVSLVAQGTATSRSDIARHTGLARSTVSQRVEQLLDLGLLVDAGRSPSRGGRPPVSLSLNPRAGVLLSADVGASHVRMALSDLGASLLAELSEPMDVNDGAQAVLGQVWAGFRELLAETGNDVTDVRGVGLGMPGPVEFATGTVVRPPIMAGWDGYRVPGYFVDLLDAPVIVDNDVNIMALGEYWARQDVEYLLYVKVGTGIGCGIISEGHLHRGTDGAAGDIGHIQLPGHESTRCHCGNTGCVEAVASGSALVRALSQQGLDVSDSHDVVRLAEDGNVLARHAVREAGQHIGEVLASLVSFYNPAAIVLGGALAQVSEELLASIRGVVYRRALPLATRNLRMETSRLGPQAGVLGATVLTLQHVLSPAGLATLLRATI
ncbi:MAG: ROK family protein [Streptosporangiales bacterium]|nr:ROK family protein [Streptosporangiales bacterium]